MRHDVDGTGAVVLHSGGQDSTTCLAWAIDLWGKDNVYPVAFNYSQRHEIELEKAEEICEMLGVAPLRILAVPALHALGAAALTNKDISVNVNPEGTGNKYAEEHNLPSTFVPGRNLLFFTLAAAYGATLGHYNLVTGVCQTDDAGYPDCREVFVKSAARTLRLALDEDFVDVHAPLLHKSKAETFALAASLGVLGIVVEHTHTCYHGDRSARFPWGYGCGKCGACQERARGWFAFAEMDPDAAAKVVL